MIIVRILAGAAGLAALAAAGSATAQRPVVVNRAQLAIDQCTSAVQNRLNMRAERGGMVGGRVVSVTRVNYRDRGSRIQVRGLASSSGYAYGPYGVGLYGVLGATQGANLTFRCSVDTYGRVRDLDINRR
ncbi:MAG: hypothetical protein ACJ8E3_06675 [Sphingomicrobium sp.]